MYLVLEAVKEKWVEMKYISTKEMKADGFTKSLDEVEFVQLRSNVLHLSDWVNKRTYNMMEVS
jgi:hypothetical protein